MNVTFHPQSAAQGALALQRLRAESQACLRGLVVCGLILALSTMLVTLHVRAYPKLSPFDEMVHFDYLYKVAHGQMLRRGDKVGYEAMREESCRGVNVHGLVVPKCGGHYDPNAYQESGYNTADIHPPAYYFLTGAAGRLLVDLRVARQLLTAARLIGGLWLGLGLASVWLATGMFGASILARVFVTAQLASSTLLLHLSSIVNPDATALFAGGMVLLAGLIWERRPAAWPLLVVSAVLATLLKETNGFAVLGVAIYLLVRWRSTRRENGQANPHLWLGSLLLGTFAGLTELSWLLVHHLLSAPNIVIPMDQYWHRGYLQPTWVISDLGSYLASVGAGTGQPPFGSPLFTTLSGLFGLLALAACAGAILYRSASSRLNDLAIATLIILLIAPPLFTIQVFLLSHVYIGHASLRYSISIWPLAATVLAAATRRKLVVGALGGLAIASLGSVVAALVGLPIP